MVAALFAPTSGGLVLAAALIFAATYLVIAMGRLPGLRLDRTGAALLGASLMVASGTLSLEEAYAMARYLRTFVPGTEVSKPPPSAIWLEGP